VSLDDALAPLRSYRERNEHWIVGLMTGTSGDAVDAALVRFEGLGLESRHTLEGYLELGLSPDRRAEILEIASASSVAPERLLALDVDLAEDYAATVASLLSRAGRAPSSVDAIGLHGQTVRHVPRASGAGSARSLQIGSAAVLAERAGIPVVSNFRARDTAAGGEGAPLVPIVDWWLFRNPGESRVLLNLGGMANLTWLPRGRGPEEVRAFDTGPGNVLIDGLMATRPDDPRPFDEGGEAARRGTPDEELVGQLLDDSFFRQVPPRSTGREKFGRDYIEALRALGRARGLSEDDLVATATTLTASSVADAVARFLAGASVDKVYVSGGGVRNAALMGDLAGRLAPVPVTTTDSLGVAASGKEALAFAFLAHLTLCGVPGNLPGATGASRAVVLGQITPGAGS